MSGLGEQRDNLSNHIIDGNAVVRYFGSQHHADRGAPATSRSVVR